MLIPRIRNSWKEQVSPSRSYASVSLDGDGFIKVLRATHAAAQELHIIGSWIVEFKQNPEAIPCVVEMSIRYLIGFPQVREIIQARARQEQKDKEGRRGTGFDAGSVIRRSS